MATCLGIKDKNGTVKANSFKVNSLSDVEGLTAALAGKASTADLDGKLPLVYVQGIASIENFDIDNYVPLDKLVLFQASWGSNIPTSYGVLFHSGTVTTQQTTFINVTSDKPITQYHEIRCLIKRDSNYMVIHNLNELEQLVNKVTGITSASNDSQYPTAKCVYESIDKTQSVKEVQYNGVSASAIDIAEYISTFDSCKLLLTVSGVTGSVNTSSVFTYDSIFITPTLVFNKQTISNGKYLVNINCSHNSTTNTFTYFIELIKENENTGGGGATIDDSTTANNKVWSSSKVNTALAGKANTEHSHSSIVGTRSTAEIPNYGISIADGVVNLNVNSFTGDGIASSVTSGNTKLVTSGVVALELNQKADKSQITSIESDIESLESKFTSLYSVSNESYGGTAKSLEGYFQNGKNIELIKLDNANNNTPLANVFVRTGCTIYAPTNKTLSDNTYICILVKIGTTIFVDALGPYLIV